MRNMYFGGVTNGREESPGIEHAFQDECIRVFKELIESKGLYQNVRIDEAIFSKLPETFIKEFKKRPLLPWSRGEGDDHSFSRMGPSGSQALGTPDDEMEAGFYLPNVTLHCSKCAATHIFLSMTSNVQSIFGPYPIIGDDTEQLFSLCYRCAACRAHFIVFQILRKGFKIQLTGRSIPYRPEIAKEWPNAIKQVIQDAFQAAAENDVPGAYYHLRTALEFYLKDECSISRDTKSEGSELCEMYNQKCDSRLKSNFPSVLSIYGELSSGMHSRVVKPERFRKLADDFLAHLKAKELFSQFSNKRFD